MGVANGIYHAVGYASPGPGQITVGQGFHMLFKSLSHIAFCNRREQQQRAQNCGPVVFCTLCLQGHVAVMNANKEMLALLGKGGFFGELALLATARRTAQVSACCCAWTCMAGACGWRVRACMRTCICARLCADVGALRIFLMAARPGDPGLL